MLRAHLEGKIDVTKPIKSFIEREILREIETDVLYKVITLNPMLNSGGELMYVTEDLINSFKSCILPWMKPGGKKETSTEDLEAKAAFLKEINNQL